ncbi:hypothetical protein KEH51_05565 [[Brevibacterium] frigoritolerans]|uniref:Uncharacterized protein n=1 Tax=Peribacillus frigoritolerans TaxID=450367 RepID=A0A941J685_9BACI|nr:hypothetical protein [Peribacillus frigoritolerans]
MLLMEVKSLSSLGGIKRGQPIGVYVSQRVWLIPMFVMIPGGQLPAPFEWYPVFTIGDMSLSPIVLPILIGFEQKFMGRSRNWQLRRKAKR